LSTVTQNLAPGLLLAMPQLPDPNFSRSVVLMIEHDTGGSWGLVVNRPTPIQVSDVLQRLEMAWAGDADEVVWQGGPVEPWRGCVLHPPVALDQEDEPLIVVPGVVLSTLPEQLRALAERPPQPLRFLLGYAGWGGGQLEHELSEGSWLMAPATPDLIFECEAEDMWQAAIASLGIDPTTLVPASGIH
jgi:putative transcriptional regulator